MKRKSYIDAPDVGRPSVTHLAAGDVHDAELPKHHPVAQTDEDLDSVLRYHVQLASLDDVHLLPHVPLPAHVVARREHLQLQLEYERLQQAGLTVLEVGMMYPRYYFVVYLQPQLSIVKTLEICKYVLSIRYNQQYRTWGQNRKGYNIDFFILFFFSTLMASLKYVDWIFRMFPKSKKDQRNFNYIII